MMSKRGCHNCGSRLNQPGNYCSKECITAMMLEARLDATGWEKIARHRAYGGVRALLRRWQLIHKGSAAVAFVDYDRKRLRVNEQGRVSLDDLLDYLGYTREELAALPEEE